MKKEKGFCTNSKSFQVERISSLVDKISEGRDHFARVTWVQEDGVNLKTKKWKKSKKRK